MPTQTSDPISDQFGKIWGIVSPGTKSAAGGSGIAHESIEGNSLIKSIRSQNNLLGDQAQEQYGGGQANIGAGVNALSQPFNYWSAILSGDPGALAAAIGPTAGAVGKQYAAAERGADQHLAKGGFRSTRMAELPFEKAGKISDSILSQQGKAADSLTHISQILSSLGLNQEGISTQLMSILSGAQLGVRGQDNQENAATMGLIGNIFEGLGSVAGGFAARSDRRFKRDIKYVGLENGHRVYSFVYTFDPRSRASRFVGVMSDQVRKIRPDAVVSSPIGDLVNYGKIGVVFRLENELEEAA